jgi:hypothetical protein
VMVAGCVLSASATTPFVDGFLRRHNFIPA